MDDKKFKQYTELCLEWDKCKVCAIGCLAHHHAHARGNIVNPRVIVVGEAPSRTEDRTGIPFCGQAGTLLDQLLSTSEIDSSSCLFTNMVLCRPTDADDGPNRLPNPQEIANCEVRLQKLFQIFRPAACLLVGSSAIASVPVTLVDLGLRHHYFQITNLSYILRNGGINSSEWFNTLAVLKDLRRFLRGT